MTFWRKKKDIVLDCYTSNPFAYNFARINYGHHFIPEWWKQTPKEVSIKGRGTLDGESATIKKCPGLINHYKKSIIIPLWTELRLMFYAKNEDKDCAYISSHDEFSLGAHPKEQFLKFSGEDGYSLKIESPWYLRCREDIQFTSTQPIWNHRDTMFHLQMLPGTLDFKTQTSPSMNYFFEKKEHRVELNIEPLTPMVMMHPMSERKVVLKHHYVDNKDTLWKVMSSDFAMFKNRGHGFRFKGQLEKKNQMIKKVDEMNKDEWKF